MATIQTICSDALLELGVLAQGETMSADVGDFMRLKLQRILNLWNAKRVTVYATVFQQFTLVPNTAPHTIGPTGATFTVTQRPVSIEAIGLGLNTSNPPVFLPLNVRDADWWQAQAVPALTSDVPTDFFYNPTWPNGQINFWPIPTAAYLVQLQIRTLFDDTLTLNQTFDLPPGYQEAITLTLAEQSARSFGKPMSPELKDAASMARAIVFANNDPTPRLSTLDSGMEGPGGGMRPSFNWLIGSDQY